MILICISLRVSDVVSHNHWKRDWENWESNKVLCFQPGQRHQREGYSPEPENDVRNPTEWCGEVLLGDFQANTLPLQIHGKMPGMKENYAKPTYSCGSLDWNSQDSSSGGAAHTTDLISIMHMCDLEEFGGIKVSSTYWENVLSYTVLQRNQSRN